MEQKYQRFKVKVNESRASTLSIMKKIISNPSENPEAIPEKLLSENLLATLFSNFLYSNTDVFNVYLPNGKQLPLDSFGVETWSSFQDLSQSITSGEDFPLLGKVVRFTIDSTSVCIAEVSEDTFTFSTLKSISGSIVATPITDELMPEFKKTYGKYLTAEDCFNRFYVYLTNKQYYINVGQVLKLRSGSYRKLKSEFKVSQSPKEASPVKQRLLRRRAEKGLDSSIASPPRVSNSEVRQRHVTLQENLSEIFDSIPHNLTPDELKEFFISKADSIASLVSPTKSPKKPSPRKRNNSIAKQLFHSAEVPNEGFPSAEVPNEGFPSAEVPNEGSQKGDDSVHSKTPVDSYEITDVEIKYQFGGIPDPSAEDVSDYTIEYLNQSLEQETKNQPTETDDLSDYLIELNEYLSRIDRTIRFATGWIQKFKPDSTESAIELSETYLKTLKTHKKRHTVTSVQIAQTLKDRGSAIEETLKSLEAELESVQKNLKDNQESSEEKYESAICAVQQSLKNYESFLAQPNITDTNNEIVVSIRDFIEESIEQRKKFNEQEQLKAAQITEIITNLSYQLCDLQVFFQNLDKLYRDNSSKDRTSVLDTILKYNSQFNTHETPEAIDSEISDYQSSTLTELHTDYARTYQEIMTIFSHSTEELKELKKTTTQHRQLEADATLFSSTLETIKKDLITLNASICSAYDQGDIKSLATHLITLGQLIGPSFSTYNQEKWVECLTVYDDIYKILNTLSEELSRVSIADLELDPEAITCSLTQEGLETVQADPFYLPFLGPNFVCAYIITCCSDGSHLSLETVAPPPKTPERPIKVSFLDPLQWFKENGKDTLPEPQSEDLPFNETMRELYKFCQQALKSDTLPHVPKSTKALIPNFLISIDACLEMLGQKDSPAPMEIDTPRRTKRSQVENLRWAALAQLAILLNEEDPSSGLNERLSWKVGLDEARDDEFREGSAAVDIEVDENGYLLVHPPEDPVFDTQAVDQSLSTPTRQQVLAEDPWTPEFHAAHSATAPDAEDLHSPPRTPNTHALVSPDGGASPTRQQVLAEDLHSPPRTPKTVALVSPDGVSTPSRHQVLDVGPMKPEFHAAHSATAPDAEDLYSPQRTPKSHALVSPDGVGTPSRHQVLAEEPRTPDVHASQSFKAPDAPSRAAAKANKKEGAQQAPILFDHEEFGTAATINMQEYLDYHEFSQQHSINMNITHYKKAWDIFIDEHETSELLNIQIKSRLLLQVLTVKGSGSTNSHELTEAQRKFKDELLEYLSTKKYPFLNIAFQTLYSKPTQGLNHIITHFSKEDFDAKVKKIEDMEVKPSGAYWPLKNTGKVTPHNYPDMEASTYRFKIETNGGKAKCRYGISGQMTNAKQLTPEYYGKLQKLDSIILPTRNPTSSDNFKSSRRDFEDKNVVVLLATTQEGHKLYVIPIEGIQFIAETKQFNLDSIYLSHPITF